MFESLYCDFLNSFHRKAYRAWIEMLEVLADSDKYAYGLAGIRALFDCSKSTAERLKNGKIKAACRQYGRKIVVDKDKALKLFNS